jgi:hypothetical protein
MEVEQSAVQVSRCIEDSLHEKRGCLIGRWGTIEFEMLWFGLQERRYILERNAGVFPLVNKADMEEWAKKYIKAIQNSDCLATGWYGPIKKFEQQFIEHIQWSGQQIVLRGIEPYYVDSAWTKLLKERRVCVVTSFTETGKKQVAKGANLIWGEKGDSIWPAGIQWSWVQTGYSPVLAQGQCTWTEASGEEISSWKEAVKYMVDEVLKTNAEIVLIGCGGLGMIVGSELKLKGKICVVMGGATQVFLGIKGHRWETHGFISKLWNEEWVYPAANEIPAAAHEIENGCYW